MLKHVLNNKLLTYLLVLKNIVYLYLSIYIYICRNVREILFGMYKIVPSTFADTVQTSLNNKRGVI